MFGLICMFMFLFVDSLELLLGSGGFDRIFSYLKEGKKYGLKQVLYMTEKEQSMADCEERTLELLKGSCPYLINFIESFEDVF
jgi:hypothetical protein